MRLADDDTAIQLGNETVHLRPTLRAAFRLERRHGGFRQLAGAIADGSLNVMADVIREGSNMPSTVPAFLNAVTGPQGLGNGIEAVTPVLLDFVLCLAGHNEGADAPEGEPDGRSRLTFAEHHAKLYRVATGWLGWTPDATWNATPAEILEAYQGRMDMLQAIFGGSQTNTPDSTGPSDQTEDEIRAGWATLKTLSSTHANRM